MSSSDPPQSHPSGLDWGGYVDALVAERGSIAALAAHLAAQRGFVEDVSSVERGLRRLRGRGFRDGGTWGRRILAAYGVPAAIEERVRWMGHYHSRFTDLPTSICMELLRPWDRPPVSESPARVWVQLGLASVCLRRRNLEGALHHLDQAKLAASSHPAAEIEVALVRSFAVSRVDEVESRQLLAQAGELLHAASIEDDHHSCLTARYIDQLAYRHNRPRRGQPDHSAALALYQTIPDSGPPFARCRRHNGIGWSLHMLGDDPEALRHAELSVQEAGDSGSLRLRAMALNLLAQVLEGEARDRAKGRARAIARHLEDEDLALRYMG